MKFISGIIPPMVTPLKDHDELDAQGLERLIEHIIAGGVHGIFILGTTGEAPSLSHRLRRELIDRVCSQVGVRLPILVGITDSAFVESVEIANYAAGKGASALVLAPPYYFPAGQPELIEYLGHILKRLPLPLYLYNMPSLTKLFFEPETVRRIAEHKGVIGLKDSSGNMNYFHQLQLLFKDKPDFSLFVGPEELLAESLLLGGDGGVNGGANFYPTLYVEVYNAAQNRDLDTVIKLHEKIMKIRESIYSVGKYGSSIIKGTKCALSIMGICDDFMAEPFHRFKEAEREIVRQHLISLGLL
jgi:dihydrodipicolinate synthase/N-acetylneuraminate lyase